MKWSFQCSSMLFQFAMLHQHPASKNSQLHIALVAISSVTSCSVQSLTASLSWFLVILLKKPPNHQPHFHHLSSSIYCSEPSDRMELGKVNSSKTVMARAKVRHTALGFSGTSVQQRAPVSPWFSTSEIIHIHLKCIQIRKT